MDCDDFDVNIRPGTKYMVDPGVDYNCNGISGTNAQEVPYEGNNTVILLLIHC
jgi:hypothetical protein